MHGTTYVKAISFLLLISFASAPPTKANESDNKTRSIELIGVAEIPGRAINRSGFSHSLDFDTTNNMLGGFSGIAFDRQNNEYCLLSDRGPKDGAVDWSCRFHQFQIQIQPEKSPSVLAILSGTTILRDERGAHFSGLAAAYQPAPMRAARLDPEGIRIAESGNIFISDEYGPRLIEFSPDGHMIREFPMPSRFLIDNPGLNKPDENSKNIRGRQTNRGMEGLALSTDQSSLFGLMQSPLLQDSFRAQITDKPTGLNCRLQQFSITGQPLKELLYQLDDESNKLNEILACGPTSFIVIERDGESGTEARYKKLTLISTENATDISSFDQLPPREIPVGVQAVEKSLLIDLLDPQWNLAGPDMPEKIEGLAFGPDLVDGRRILLVATDNDFESANPSYIYVFAVASEVVE